jgi:thymidylate synthase (FAD)
MRVTLLAYTQLNPDVEQLPEPLRAAAAARRQDGDSTSPECLMEYAGRVCYRSTGAMGGNPRFISARIGEGHESIIEHVSFTFLVEGISRACSHQLVRHRIASYSQESQRYCELAAGDEVVVPPALEQDPQALAVWNGALESLQQAYRALRERGIRKEDARFLLPNATGTRLAVTMNARSLRHFFTVRLHVAAQWEIRSVAREMLRLVYPLAPSVFADLREMYLSEA